jgi:WD40 repeat protein
VWYAAFSKDGRWVATSSSGHSTSQSEDVKIWNAATGEPAHAVDTGGAGMGAFSPDGQHFFANGSKGAQVLELASWKPGPQLSQEIRDVAVYPTYSPAGGLLFCTVGESVKVFRSDAFAAVAMLEPPAPLSSGRLRFTADGSRLGVLGSDGSLQLWDLKMLRSSLTRLGLDWER